MKYLCSETSEARAPGFGIPSRPVGEGELLSASMAARSVGRERPMPMPPPGRWQARNVGAGEDGPALSLRS